MRSSRVGRWRRCPHAPVFGPVGSRAGRLLHGSRLLVLGNYVRRRRVGRRVYRVSPRQRKSGGPARLRRAAPRPPTSWNATPPNGATLSSPTSALIPQPSRKAEGGHSPLADQHAGARRLAKSRACRRVRPRSLPISYDVAVFLRRSPPRPVGLIMSSGRSSRASDVGGLGEGRVQEIARRRGRELERAPFVRLSLTAQWSGRRGISCQAPRMPSWARASAASPA